MGRDEVKQILENAFTKNQTLSFTARSRISDYILDFNDFFSEHNVELDFDNLSVLLETVTFVESEEISSAIEYNAQKNTLELPKDKFFTQKKIDHDFQKSVLLLATNVYSIETEKYNQGVNFDVNGNEYGKVINDKLSDRIIELVYGNDDDKIVTLPTAEDTIAYDFEVMLGSEKLLTYYVNGRGDLLYSSMVQLLDSEEKCIEFFETLDKYRTTDRNEMRDLIEVEGQYEKKRDEIFKRIMTNQLAI